MDIRVSTTLLALGLAAKMEEQNNKLNTLVCFLQSKEGASCHVLRYENLQQSLIRMLRGGNLEKMMQMKRRMLW